VVNRPVNFFSGDLKPEISGTAQSGQSVPKSNPTIMKLYVGNLSFNTTENDLEDLFNQYGAVSEVALMTDHATGRSRGFAFVTMGSAAEGNAAIEATNGKQVAGRNLTVNEARPREDRGPRSGGGGGGGGRDERRSFSNSRR
jgi:RNA recognition motif-containing protein